MSTSTASVSAVAPHVLDPLDALVCQHQGRHIPVPVQVVDRLRGLNLWTCCDPPEQAVHVCKPAGCFVMTGHPDHMVMLHLIDWQLAADRDGRRTCGIVVEDHTAGQAGAP